VKPLKRDFMPQEPTAHWWQTNGAAVEIEFNLLPGAKPVRDWLFSYEGALLRRYHGFNVFWLRGWICVLGLRLGAGVFHRGDRFEQHCVASAKADAA
jgi:hypothetical protein